MHPSRSGGFDWREESETHLARHGVRPWEVDEVFLNGPVWAPNKKGMTGAWLMLGWTDGGRALSIVVAMDEDTAMLRAITGWDTTTAEAARFLRKRSRR
jgi:hypothetical protein